MSYIGKVNAGGGAHLVGSTLYGTCATLEASPEKAVACANFDALMEGVTIHVKFANSNTAENPTLNVNSTGARNIYRYGTTAPSSAPETSWAAGAVVSFTYDGMSWVMNDWLNSNYRFESGNLVTTTVPNVLSAGTVPSLTVTETSFDAVRSFASGSMPTLRIASKTCTRINSYTTNTPTSAEVVNGVFKVSLGESANLDKQDYTFDAVDDWQDGETPSLVVDPQTIGSASNWSAGTPTVLGTAITVATGAVGELGTGNAVLTGSATYGG